jgi:hypothetical protein
VRLVLFLGQCRTPNCGKTVNISAVRNDVPAAPRHAPPFCELASNLPPVVSFRFDRSRFKNQAQVAENIADSTLKAMPDVPAAAFILRAGSFFPINARLGQATAHRRLQLGLTGGDKCLILLKFRSFTTLGGTFQPPK